MHHEQLTGNKEILSRLEELTCDFTVCLSVDLFAHLLKMQTAIDGTL